MSDATVDPTVIRARKGLNSSGLRDLWGRRELVAFLVWRNLKVRYRQTALGVAWAVLQPLALMATFAVVLGRLARVPSENDLPYPLMVYIGLVLWNFFSQAVTVATGSLVDNAHLLSKIYFPRLALPVSAVCTYIPDIAIAVVLLFVLMSLYGVAPAVSSIWILLVVVWAILLAFGIGALLAATSARFRDLRHALPFLLQLLFFASPIVYGVSLVPPGWRPLYFLNPVAGAVGAFRAALVGTPAPGGYVFVSLASTIFIVVAGWGAFQRAERGLADVL